MIIDLKMPPCDNFGIEHNPHKGLYKQRVEDVEGPLWISDDERRKAIEADDFWVCVWLPCRSDEYRARAAHDLVRLLEFVSKEDACMSVRNGPSKIECQRKRR
jgi:hypothetical protein